MRKGLQKSSFVPLRDVHSCLSRCLTSSANLLPRVELPSSSNEPLIACKRKEFNHYVGQTYKKFQEIPLASKGWHHSKSRGDFFTVSPVGEIPAFSEVASGVTFESLGLVKTIVNALREQGISQPTAIQEKGIKAIMHGKHTLMAAETGSGKTLAYLLPLLQQISWLKSRVVREMLNAPLAIIISPSRDLAEQIGNVAKYFCEVLGLDLKVVTGGHTKRLMMNPSFKDVDLVVTSFGAFKKLTSTGIYRTQHVRHIVLDEADTLLDDSFNEDLAQFLRRFQFNASVPALNSLEESCVQIILASATLPTSIDELLGDIIPLDDLSKVTTKNLHHVQIHVPQKFIRLSRGQKPAQLLKIVRGDEKKKYSVLIFSNRSPTCDWMSLFLNENGVKCSHLNGSMPYEIRAGRFRDFQSGNFSILSCTDVSSRGLNTLKVKHVINYDFPMYMADYIHRCGRVGRVGSIADCHVTNFVAGPTEVDLVQKIEQAVRLGEPLPNVNGNISKIIKHKIFKHSD